MFNNEKGFSPFNINVIYSVAKSTKKGNKKTWVHLGERGKAGVVFDKANKGNLRPDGQKVGITADDKFISGIHVETAEDLSGEGVEMCTKFEDGALGNKCVNIEMSLSEKKKSVVSLNECKDGEGAACLISDAAVTNLMDASSISSTTLFTLYLVDVCVTNGQKQKKWKRLARHKVGPTAAHGRHVGNDPVSELRTNLGRRLVGSHDTAVP
ncbi:hypothetical protein ACOSQ2_025143 [Xanthoceras sorbifolium]